MKIVVQSTGFITFSNQRMRCSIGRGGLSSDKHEGDGATPTGEFNLGGAFTEPIVAQKSR